jgi:L-fuconolactonase
MAKIIDAHHHLWRYTAHDYSWIGDAMQSLRHDFLPADLQLAAKDAEVNGSIVVQARQTLEETRWLLQCAAENHFIEGVRGWLPLAEHALPDLLHALRDQPKLKGLRHVIQDEPDNFYILREDFNQGIAALADTGLVFDILVYERHLPQTIEFVSRHPQQTFVLDHLAKPNIRNKEMQPWKDNLKRLADFENVVCKCSGLATEADWATWSIEDIRPYLDVAREAFGAERLMAGSDWPVCLVATGYSRWWSMLKEWSSQLSHTQRNQFLGGTAQRVYKLEAEAAG